MKTALLRVAMPARGRAGGEISRPEAAPTRARRHALSFIFG